MEITQNNTDYTKALFNKLSFQPLLFYLHAHERVRHK